MNWILVGLKQCCISPGLVFVLICTLCALALLQSLCLGLNWSINLNKLSQQASCVQAEVMECTVIKVEDEPMDVSDNSSFLKLEETLKDYISRMEVGDHRFHSARRLFDPFNHNYLQLQLFSMWTAINTWPYDHISFQVQKRELLRMPGFSTYCSPVFPTQVNKVPWVIFIHPKWTFGSSSGSGHSISFVSLVVLLVTSFSWRIHYIQVTWF